MPESAVIALMGAWAARTQANLFRRHAAQASLEHIRRAMSACMGGRGYQFG